MKETMVDTRVTYTLERGGRFFIAENVPARVCRETGEQYFAPETVEHIQSIIKSRKRTDRVIETPVYSYASKRFPQPIAQPDRGSVGHTTKVTANHRFSPAVGRHLPNPTRTYIIPYFGNTVLPS
jgi:YgiT-type zinc finger domain-containing protein